MNYRLLNRPQPRCELTSGPFQTRGKKHDHIGSRAFHRPIRQAVTNILFSESKQCSRALWAQLPPRGSLEACVELSDWLAMQERNNKPTASRMLIGHPVC
ncbi:hypothetical protein RRG08_020865 [Elysia crispata]|uniref:Uncharacterized protein n=1 Tax=Elysia crispata TaxID=231223 RepID=A0AAE1CMI0_9GAST|nr:hypothetical protein RRG08_020865 [Elysia crispata]